MLKIILLNLIRFYQLFISPLWGRHCQFYPSCSEYTKLSINQYGALKGCRKGLAQLLRCHSWNF